LGVVVSDAYVETLLGFFGFFARFGFEGVEVGG
jgi:hypothetical protein